MTTLCAAAALVLTPSCGRETSLRQPEPVVRIAEPSAAAVVTPAPKPTNTTEPLQARVRPAIQAPPARGSTALIKDYIRKVFGRHGEAAVRVAACETGGTFNPLARGRLGERGILQIRPEFHSWRIKAVGGTSLWSYKTNIRVGYHLFREQGWKPWTCARRLGLV